MLTPKELETIKTVLSVMRCTIMNNNALIYRSDVLEVLEQFTAEESVIQTRISWTNCVACGAELIADHPHEDVDHLCNDCQEVINSDGELIDK